MEVKINKTNNQKYVTIPKESPLKEGDKVDLFKVQPITKEQLQSKVNNDDVLQDLIKYFRSFQKSMFNDTRWKFIERIKEELSIKSIEVGEGYEIFDINGVEVEYIYGEAFNDDFEGKIFNFCNNGIGGYGDDYLKEIIETPKSMKSMVSNSRELGIVKVYTDLVESYHDIRKRECHRQIMEQLDCPEVHENGFDLYIKYKDMTLVMYYGEATSIVIKQDATKIYLFGEDDGEE